MQEWRDSVKFTYGVVDVDKSSPLGTGSYGAVYRAKCDDLQCAAKVIHEALLINAPAGGQGGVVDRFYQECHFLSELKHPNIVQYLGTHYESVTGRLVLLMELMDESLTRHLENTVSPLSLHVELDLCCDIALALSYLHSNHIIHRDLTGNNVLLYAGKRAKVTDFGVSKLIDPDVLQRSSMSLCPGTTVYMPPEALQEIKNPKYTEKLDCFSYGVLCIQIFTRKFPKPSQRYRHIDSGDSSQRITAVNIVSERVRRQDHIQMVKSDHIFLPTTLECLSDEEIDRPSSQEICHRLALLKGSQQYISSRESSDGGQQELCRNRGAERNTILQLERDLEDSREECTHLQRQLDLSHDEHRREVTHKNTVIERQNSTISRLEQQRYQSAQDYHKLESSLETLRQENDRLCRELSIKSRLLEELQERKESVTNIKLKWREGPDASTGLRNEPDAVVDSDIIYFKYFWGKSIYSFNSIHNTWVVLPDCPVSSFSMAILNSFLTVIGGKNSDYAPVNKLYTYGNKKWTIVLPNMQLKRYWTISKTWESFLIVMGGEGEGRRTLNAVEVLDLDTSQWSFAVSLLRPIDSATAVVCGDHLYIGGGSHQETARYAMVCSLPKLLENAKEIAANDSLDSTRIWNQIDDFPHKKTTLVSSKGHIFAIGGKDDSEKPTSAVYVFNALGKQWERVGEMTVARSSCYVVAYSSDEIMVVGGLSENSEALKLMEIAQIFS